MGKTVELSPETHEKLRTFVQQRGLKICFLVDHVICEWLDRHEKLHASRVTDETLER